MEFSRNFFVIDLISPFRYKGTLLGELNVEQQSAVRNMINKTDELPYILFGPPGKPHIGS